MLTDLKISKYFIELSFRIIFFCFCVILEVEMIFFSNCAYVSKSIQYIDIKRKKVTDYVTTLK